MNSKAFRSFMVVILLLLCIVPVASAAPAAAPTHFDPSSVKKIDNRPDPLSTKQAALKQAALQAKLEGKAPGKVKEVARGQYVELAREGEGAIWTVLGEFSDFPHNNMPQPDRKVNNTTIWTADFSRAYFMNLLFNQTPGANSMRNFYKELSSNRYTVYGDVTDWVTVPGTAASYDDTPDANTWVFLRDSINTWYADQIAAGQTPQQIDDYLAQFDVYDRYDYNGNGNFNEPDGYIDTFQSVHAGEGEEAGGGALGALAIWSHSWYAFSGDQGKTGPDFNKLGGIQIGSSKYWVGKYTIQPENGGVGVFTHEYGHDLGLPDLYDTAGGENGTGFWTLMSSGSWMNDGKVDIGSRPSHMGAWEKFQLGWLNYQVASAGKKADIKLGPMEFNTKQAQALFVILPKKTVVSNIGAPFAGANYYYSGAGDKLDSFMYKSFTLPAGASLAAKVKYSIELDYDYAYLVASTDGGVTWTSVATNLSSTTDPNGSNKGQGITGSSSGNWVDLTADLSAYTGSVLLGFRYVTDENTGGFGFMADDIAITGSPVDGAETAAGWTFNPVTGFHVTTGVESALFNNYYVAEYRTYKGYDATLRTGPYFFGYLNNPALGNFVDHFPYQDGLLINYWDTSQRNNNVSQHPGAGLILPIDAHFKALMRVDNGVWRNRIQSYDSTFTLDKTDALKLHVNSVLSPLPSLPAVKAFNDTTTYWDAANPSGSVMNPKTNTIIEIRSISTIDSFMQIQVRPAK